MSETSSHCAGSRMLNRVLWVWSPTNLKSPIAPKITDNFANQFFVKYCCRELARFLDKSQEIVMLDFHRFYPIEADQVKIKLI